MSSILSWRVWFACESKTSLHRVLQRKIHAFTTTTFQAGCIQNSNTIRARNLSTSSLNYNKSDILLIDNYEPELIRNFSIIAHIDHGKSTIADRILEYTGTIKSGSSSQVLDKLQVERERGITVKAQTASIFHNYKGKNYLLNLIDTPGHVDFNYEVRCSLAACQGTILVVDAAQGVQAQTLANFFLAFERDLKIVPVINKVDLPSADVEGTIRQMESMFDIDPSEVVCVSAKTGLNIPQLVDAVVERVPSPVVSCNEPLKALLFDSWYDDYRGIICLVELFGGKLRSGNKVVFAHNRKTVYEVTEVGIMHPDQVPVQELRAGQVGYVICGIKGNADAPIGDTLFLKDNEVEPLPGFQPPKPMVFAGLYPIEQGDYHALASALDRLMFNDSSVSFQRDVSASLGPGWQLGFLGVLHMEVFNQRLEQEYGAQALLTSPSVLYRAVMRNGSVIDMRTPSHFPEDITKVAHFEEPMVIASLVFPEGYVGPMISLCENHRGEQKLMEFIGQGRVLLKYRLPLSEVVEHFYDRVKSTSSGYATFDYEDDEYAVSDLAKLQLLLNNDPVDSLSAIVHSSRAHNKGKAICKQLKEVIPRQLFDVAIQATLKNKVVARETVKALRKDVTAKCYGGDITRKRKLRFAGGIFGSIVLLTSCRKQKVKIYNNINISYIYLCNNITNYTPTMIQSAALIHF
eukprot:m.35696 g.35696  ORF g.35696 m.35696 type:complete len:689 (+) comp6622_c0_seq2:25-2091(+)